MPFETSTLLASYQRYQGSHVLPSMQQPMLGDSPERQCGKLLQLLKICMCFGFH